MVSMSINERGAVHCQQTKAHFLQSCFSNVSLLSGLWPPPLRGRETHVRVLGQQQWFTTNETSTFFHYCVNVGLQLLCIRYLWS